MIRQYIVPKALRGEKNFRWRGGDVSRLEGLSDAVFAFSLTLLVVSLEAPKTFEGLKNVFIQLPVFAVCFALLVWIWYCHYLFHRRFGFEGAMMTFLNSVLLFLVVFYVYPLKFLFTWLYTTYVLGDEFRGGGQGTVILLYSAGFTGLFLLFTILYVYAYRRREELELNEVERIITRGTIRAHLLSAGLGATSIALAIWAHPALAGLIYFLMGPVHGVSGYMTGRAVERAAGSEG